jgi:hypothetical protein
MVQDGFMRSRCLDVVTGDLTEWAMLVPEPHFAAQRYHLLAEGIQ